MRTYAAFSRNPFRMRSSKKTGGRGFILPTLLCLQSGRRERVCPEQGRGATIPYLPPPIPFVFILLRALLRFFALHKNSTLFFSIASALFAKKHPGWGYPAALMPLLPCSIANLTLHAFSRWPELANRPGRLFQPFPFNLQLWTLNLLFALLPMGHGARITPFSLPPYFVPFLTSFFHYNRCASIRRENEF